MRSTRKYLAAAAAAAAALTLAACGSSGSPSGSSNGKVTLTWWSNATSGQLLTVFKGLISSYEKANPNVTISYVPIQNEQYDTKIQSALQGHKEPDIFFQRGGGFMGTQAKSGQLANLSPYIKSWVGELGGSGEAWQTGSTQYGVPYDLHTVGFWYRKDLFAKAGITSAPTTLTDLESDVAKLKAAGVAPIAVGSKDQWPDAFYWDYFAVRECSTSVLQAAVKSDNANDSCFSKAESDLKGFMATNPFVPGFLSVPAQQGAGSSAGQVASGKAAMELQGDWDPSVMQALVPASTWQSDTSQIGWFPFPSVPGSAGSQTAMLGGSDGNSCSVTAPEPACANFLEYLSNATNQTKLAGANLLPANPAGSSGVTLPADQDVMNFTKTKPYVQEYLDLAYPTSVGTALDAAVATFFANPAKAVSGSVATAINQAAARQ
jgi:raffinose/stachyose/melibiose transport system substrate-binding protein